MRQGECRHHFEDIEKSLAKGSDRHPLVPFKLKDRGKQQRQEKKNMIKPDPDMPYSMTSIGQKLRFGFGHLQVESLGWVIGGENGRLRHAPAIHLHKTAIE